MSIAREIAALDRMTVTGLRHKRVALFGEDVAAAKPHLVKTSTEKTCLGLRKRYDCGIRRARQTAVGAA